MQFTRYTIFIQYLMRIVNFNMGQASYTQGINQLSDMVGFSLIYQT